MKYILLVLIIFLSGCATRYNNQNQEFGKLTPLMEAVLYNEDLDKIFKTANKTRNINYKNEKGFTALLIASSDNQDPKVAEILISNGAEVNKPNNWGMTPLMLAYIFNPNLDVANTLIENGACLDLKDKGDLSASNYLKRRDKATLEKTKIEINKRIEERRFANIHKEQRKQGDGTSFANVMQGVAFVLHSFADGLSGTSNASPTKTTNNSSNTFSHVSNSSNSYISNTGQTYQYDLSNPVQRVRYNADPLAQLRDQINPNPLRSIEHNTGQIGGGVIK